MNWKRWAAATVTVFAIPAYAQSGGANSDPAAREAEREAVLLSFIHYANQREIDLAKLGKEKSDSPQVKAFADRLLTDHQAADDRLVTFAKGRGVDLDAVRARARATAETLEQERRSRTVGSSSGEWAFMAEPGVDREAAQLVGEHKGNVAAAATAAGKSRPAMQKLYDKALKKLGRSAIKQPGKTQSMPTDRRGQVDVADPKARPDEEE